MVGVARVTDAAWSWSRRECNRVFSGSRARWEIRLAKTPILTRQISWRFLVRRKWGAQFSWARTPPGGGARRRWGVQTKTDGISEASGKRLM